MKVIKNINNNTSICLDNNNKQVVVFGRGIGFTKPPYDLDISKVQRTFYDIDPMYIRMIENIPVEMIEISTNIIDYARNKVEYLMNSSIVFTLADHLTFAIQRYRKNMMIEMPIYYDVKSLYEAEYEVGKYALKLIYGRYKIRLPKEEISSIALHLVNAYAANKKQGNKKTNDEVINHIKSMIEKYFHLKISDDDFNYSRFVSHLQYLLKRGEQGKNINSDNYRLYVSIKDSFPDVYECATTINSYLNEISGFSFNEEELLYLMLHINRLCVREDCYR